MKPSDHLGYTPSQTNACEKLLVSLVRWSGPWRDTLYLVGGLSLVIFSTSKSTSAR